jgi:undecaprenyl-diphosphatase
MSVTLLDVMVVALIQALGEILPLSASGHLAALPALAGTPEGYAAISMAANLGVLAAIMLYFWHDMLAMGVGLWKLLKGRTDAGTRLLGLLLIGTLPAVPAGWLFLQFGGGSGGRLTAASAMLVFGLFLLVSDRLGMTVRRIEHMNVLTAFGLGLLQAAALIPGVSRTGITITAARLLGYERQAAARFSLLLAIPVLAIDAGHSAWVLSHQAELILSSDLLLAVAASASVALAALAAMMAWVRYNDFVPFAVWRILFGLGVLAVALWHG